MKSVQDRRWKVRGWIRAAGVCAVLILLPQQFSTIQFVSRGEMPASEVPLGWTFIGLLTAAVVLLCFRPYIQIQADGFIVLQGPIRRHGFHRDEVVNVVPPTDWGLRFTLRDGSKRSSFVCQDTAPWGEPRWFDVAEAVTGSRPALEDPDWDRNDDDR